MLGLGAVAIVVIGFAVAAFAMSGATLSTDSAALARYEVGAFGGTVEQVHAFGPGGRPIPIAVHAGRLEPRTRVAPGERISVDLVVRRPAGSAGWSAAKTTSS